MSQRYAGGANPYARATPYSQTDQQLEQENDSNVDQLRNKVSFLKDVSIKIGEETRNSMGFMNDMNDDYSKQHDTMKRVKNRLLRAADMQSWGWFHGFIFLVIVFIIFFLVYLFK
ncbi:hypothetical protein BCR37DRAFT_45595 [Protomyces lactucae-debilis]|uniref:t-SNARE coiled-coil homology domain-containing protein n=1 Tax=Protomyces lactucae-debilis TaxID=2754530 RepID=A0A1Y2FDG0_PROLT|nr:uncharacterized protein BCR37DRAFT_45595 [Protomyces lactucae-debilis]ORY81464.1 hypothetical protein BCR37DRAFT_45595 [Protomyces lactucae-debilis]